MENSLEGNYNGNDNKQEKPLSLPEINSEIDRIQQRLEELGGGIENDETSLRAISRGPALEHGPEIQDDLNRKKELLKDLIEKQRGLLEKRKELLGEKGN